MAFTDNLLKSILQKAFEIQKWAILAEHYDQTRAPECYGDTLTYRLSVEKELNLYDILDQLRYDGQGDYAKELENIRDELLEGVKSFDKNIDRNHKVHLPGFSLCDTAHGLFKKLRRIVEEQADDNKKLLLYAECIEDLIKDDTKLYPQIWRGEFEKLLDIVVSHLLGYDLFGELLGRIKEKDPIAAAQLKKKYDQLITLSNVEIARGDELKAIKSAVLDLVSLMRKIAEPPAEKARESKNGEKAKGSMLKMTVRSSKDNWEAIKSEYGISKRVFGKKINFVSDSFKRKIIFRDVEHAFVLASEGFAKPAVILAGGVIEELLRLYLKHKNIVAADNTFNEYIKACKQNKLLQTGIRKLSDSAREFRNFVHLSKESIKKHSITKAAAKGAVSSIFIIANDF